MQDLCKVPKEDMQDLCKVPTRADGKSVREDDAEPELLNMTTGSCVVAVKEAPLT
jgi:hypothetical protein